MKKSAGETGQDNHGAIDGLLWVGKTYDRIKCRSKENCAREGYATCFAHEAEWRGISRKIASVPTWTRADRSRIFLAHRGGETESERGRIFGYFVLGRVEVLSASRAPLAAAETSKRELKRRLASKPGGELTVSVYDAGTGALICGATVSARPRQGKGAYTAVEEHCRYWFSSLPAVSPGTKGDQSDDASQGGTPPPLHYTVAAAKEGYESSSVDGIEILEGKRRTVGFYLNPLWYAAPPSKEPGRPVFPPSGRKGPKGGGDRLPPEWSKPKTKWQGVRRRRCWDGSTIITHAWKSGGWVATGQRCPPKPRRGCNEGDLKWGPCPPDGSCWIPVKVCHKGRWVDTGIECTGVGIERFKPHRSCSLRLRPGSVYLVDALCAEITQAYSAAASRAGLEKRYAEASSDGDRARQVERGRELFRQVVTQVKKSRKSATTVPPELKGKAQSWGDLVLFDRPVPFVRHPQASFRSLERIDGADLLRQIAKGTRGIKVRVVGRAGTGKSPTKSQLLGRLATETGCALAEADRFLAGVLIPPEKEGDPKRRCGGLASLAAKELRRAGVFRLKGLGRISAGKRREKELTDDEIANALAVEMRTGISEAREARAAAAKEKASVAIQQEAAKTARQPVAKKLALRLLRALGNEARRELARGKALRIPDLGTVYCDRGEARFRPAKALGRAATFEPFRSAREAARAGCPPKTEAG